MDAGLLSVCAYGREVALSGFSCFPATRAAAASQSELVNLPIV